MEQENSSKQKQETSLPKWILIISGLFALMEILVSIFMCISPQSSLENVDHQAKGVEFLIQMWASRQFALGFIFAFATYKKSIPMLTIAYIFLLVMFAGDLVIGITQKENSMILASLVMCMISSAILYFIQRNK